jgi:hypothetical protein
VLRAACSSPILTSSALARALICAVSSSTRASSARPCSSSAEALAAARRAAAMVARSSSRRPTSVCRRGIKVKQGETEASLWDAGLSHRPNTSEFLGIHVVGANFGIHGFKCPLRSISERDKRGDFWANSSGCGGDVAVACTDSNGLSLELRGSCSILCGVLTALSQQSGRTVSRFKRVLARHCIQSNKGEAEPDKTGARTLCRLVELKIKHPSNYNTAINTHTHTHTHTHTFASAERSATVPFMLRTSMLSRATCCRNASRRASKRSRLQEDEWGTLAMQNKPYHDSGKWLLPWCHVSFELTSRSCQTPHEPAVGTNRYRR